MNQYNNQFPTLSIKRSKGAYLFDSHHSKLVDFFLNHGSLILGHSHPKITKALKNQISKGFVYPSPNPLPHQLAKLIRKSYPNIQNITFSYSYIHLLSLLSHTIQKLHHTHKQQKILLLNTKYLPTLNLTYQTYQYLYSFDLNHIESTLNSSKKSTQPFAAICTPYIHTYPQFIVQNLNYWIQLQSLCQKYHAHLVLDLQSTAFRFNTLPISPDLILFDNTIGGGFPLFAIGSKYPPHSSYTSSHIFSPLPFVAGIHTLKLLQFLKPSQKLLKLQQSLSLKTQNFKYHVTGYHSLFGIHKLPDSFHLLQFFQNHKIFLPKPFSQAYFLSTAHQSSHIERLISTLKKLN